MITCTFAGHREVFGSCTQKIENALETLIESEDTLYCYVGGMGEFDGFSAAAVRKDAGGVPVRSGDSGRQCGYGEAQRCHEPSGGSDFCHTGRYQRSR